MLVMFFLSFFHRAFSEFPLPIALKLCHMIGIWLYFIMQVQKLGGGHSPKNIRGQNMQNFGRFWTNSDFDREYPRNGKIYPKSENVMGIPPAFDEKSPVNFGPLTILNYMRVWTH